MSDFLKNQKAPHERLREDIAAVRALFSKKSFKGAFDMSPWIEDPEDGRRKNFCGTVACLGGWLQLVGKSGMTGAVMPNTPGSSEAVYGMTRHECQALFHRGYGKSLDAKLAEASAVADAIEARSKKKTSSNLLPPSTSNPEGK